MKVEIQSKDYVRMRRAIERYIPGNPTDTALWDACMADLEIPGLALAYGWNDHRVVEKLVAKLKELGR